MDLTDLIVRPPTRNQPQPADSMSEPADTDPGFANALRQEESQGKTSDAGTSATPTGNQAEEDTQSAGIPQDGKQDEGNKRLGDVTAARAPRAPADAGLGAGLKAGSAEATANSIDPKAVAARNGVTPSVTANGPDQAGKGGPSDAANLGQAAPSLDADTRGSDRSLAAASRQTAPLGQNALSEPSQAKVPGKSNPAPPLDTSNAAKDVTAKTVLPIARSNTMSNDASSEAPDKAVEPGPARLFASQQTAQSSGQALPEPLANTAVSTSMSRGMSSSEAANLRDRGDESANNRASLVISSSDEQPPVPETKLVADPLTQPKTRLGSASVVSVSANLGGEASALAASSSGSPTAVSAGTSVPPSPLMSHAGAEQTAGMVERSLASQLTAAASARSNGGIVDVLLDPPELGRVEILMELSDQGLRATLSAERQATVDLMRRHLDLLAQHFEDAGFSDVDLDFGSFDRDEATDLEDVVFDGRAPDDQTEEPNLDQAIRGSREGGIDLRL